MLRVKPKRKHSLQEENGFSLRNFVNGRNFEAFFGLVILGNAVLLALSAQYSGAQRGVDLGYPDHTEGDTWSEVFSVAEYVFGVLFVLELVLKLFALRQVFFLSKWNLFDTFVVATWIWTAVQAEVTTVFHPMLLRMMRLARLVRVVKVVKKLEAFDSLRVMIKSIQACVAVLLWSTVLLVFVEMMVGLFLTNMLAHEIENPERLVSERIELFKYFGTFSRTMISMTELTLGNFVPICRLLTENIGEEYGHAILLYKLIVGFGMVKVLSGVFMHETFKAAATDDDLMVIQKNRAQRKHQEKIMSLFIAADSAEQGYLSRQQFAEILEDPDVRMWLAAQDVEVGDARLLFDLMDDGDNMLTVGKLVKGIARLKGPAKGVDVVGLMHLTSHLSTTVTKMSGRLSNLEASTKSTFNPTLDEPQ